MLSTFSHAYGPSVCLLQKNDYSSPDGHYFHEKNNFPRVCVIFKISLFDFVNSNLKLKQELLLCSCCPIDMTFLVGETGHFPQHLALWAERSDLHCVLISIFAKMIACCSDTVEDLSLIHI